MSQTEILTVAASPEQLSEHPLAAAIVAAGRERGITMQSPTDFASLTGKGITGKVEGPAAALGNLKLMDDLGV